MKKKFYSIAAAALALSLVTLSGCGEVKTPEPEVEATPEIEASAEVEAAAEVEATVEQETAEAREAAENFTLVRSVEELVEAIGPGADIVMAQGRYNLTDFLGGFSDGEIEQWNEKHEYVQIIPVFDGAELEIRDLAGLRIRGGAEQTGGTEIVTEPRSAALLHFLDCSDIELEGLTMGHTETGDCSGNVLNFRGCRDIRLRAMDIYGCGVYGISTDEGSTGLTVSDCVIRDCALGPFALIDAEDGEFLFTDCVFTGSDAGGYIGFLGKATVSFVRCTFGEEESYSWRWDETASFEDCVWADDDDGFYDWEPPAFEPENMVQMTVDEASLEDTYWVGYAAVNPESGETEDLLDYESSGEASLEFGFGGRAVLEYRGERAEYEWKSIDEETLCLTGAGRNVYVTLYAGDAVDAGYKIWLLAEYDGELVWFY
jgi:hypothetical protein